MSIASAAKPRFLSRSDLASAPGTRSTILSRSPFSQRWRCCSLPARDERLHRAADGEKYSRPLVMSRNKDGHFMGQRAGRRNWRGPLPAQGQAACQDLRKPDECQKRRQATHRNHDANEHGSDIQSGNPSAQRKPTRNGEAFPHLLATRRPLPEWGSDPIAFNFIPVYQVMTRDRGPGNVSSNQS
jgi:hypothetical protein